MAALLLSIVVAAGLTIESARAEESKPAVPSSTTAPPAGYEMSAEEAIEVASREGEISDEIARSPYGPQALIVRPDRWQVNWFGRDGNGIAQVVVDDPSQDVVEVWTGYQVNWMMARGIEGTFGRKLNAPYVWIPLCLLFLAPFVDPRRPFRLLHLDLVALLAFGISHIFFNRGEIGVSVPLVYPVLLYLLGRLLWLGLRPSSQRQRLVPRVPLAWMTYGIVLLVGLRVLLGIFDVEAIDVGLASVAGADRITHGGELYGEGYTDDIPFGDTYGPLNYLLYVPFEQAFPWSGKFDDLPAARAAAIAFDLLTLAGLMLLGRRLRNGREGRELSLALGWGWVTYPYGILVLETAANDGLVPLFTVLAMLALTLSPGREGLSALGRGIAIGLGTAAKIMPLVLAPLFATAGGGVDRRSTARSVALFAAALLLVLAVTVLPFVPDGGLREMYDRTAGHQASRESPFSLWGQIDSGDALRHVATVCAASLALLVAFVPRRKTPFQVAALGAAVIVAVEVAVAHWFYLYVVWFAPFALLAMFAPYRFEEPQTAAPRRRATRARSSGRRAAATR